MQEFFVDYGLWLLIALLVVIGLMFLLTGRGKPADIASGGEEPSVVERQEAASGAPAPADNFTAAEPAVTVPAEPAPAIVPAPQPIPVSPAVTTPSGEGDDLLRLKGVGPKLNQLLIELGVTRYAQIAGWNDADIAAIDAKLGNFRGRPVRDQWVDQARYLAAGDTAGFEAKYGKL